MNKDNYLIISFVAIIVIIIIFMIGSYNCNLNPKVWINEDLYCYHKYNPSNISSASMYAGYEIRSYKQDKINEENRRIANEKRIQEEAEKQECYDKGYFVNESFELIDYELNCKRIDYLNGHLIDNYIKMDAGHIEGHTSGFVLGYAIGFTSGSTKGEFYQYVNDRIVATGSLVKNINYHIDCNGNKLNEEIEYYDERDFVMYYVMECIK